MVAGGSGRRRLDWAENMNAFLAFMASVNWILLVIILGSVIPLAYLYRISEDPDKTWRYEQMVSDEHNEAYSPSFTNMGVFVLGYFISIALIAEKEWGYALGLFGTMAATFAVVAVHGRSSKAKERTDKLKVEAGIVEPAPGTVTTTKEVQP